MMRSNSSGVLSRPLVSTLNCIQRLLDSVPTEPVAAWMFWLATALRTSSSLME